MLFAPAVSTMLRALAWKEYRQQRALMVTGIALAVTMPTGAVTLRLATGGANAASLDDLVRELPAVFLFVALPLMTVACGSVTFASEPEGRTLHFLLSRPVAQRSLWLVKVAVAFAAVVLVAAVSLLTLWMTGTAASAPRTTSGLFEMLQHANVAYFGPIELASLSALLFASSVLCSSLMTKSLTAAAAGLALAMTAAGMVLSAWAALSMSPRIEPQWFATELLMISALLLLVSFLAFARTELFGAGPRGSRSFGPGPVYAAGGIVLSALVVVAPLAFASDSLSAATVRLTAHGLATNGRYYATTGIDETGDTTQAWVLSSDGAGLRPIAGRHTSKPVFVAGSDWVVYRSRRGPFGALRLQTDLRVVHVGSGRDRLLLRDIPAEATFFFGGNTEMALQPDDRVGFVHDGTLTVARVDGQGYETYDVSGAPIGRSLVLGFNDNDPVEIVYLHAEATPAPSEKGGGPAILGVFRPSTGASRVLHRVEDGWLLPALSWADNAPARWSPRAGWEYVPLITGNRLEIVDAVRGDVRTLHDFGPDDTTDAGLSGRCRAIHVAARRTWPGADGEVVREGQVLFGDCSATARAEAGGIRAAHDAGEAGRADDGPARGSARPVGLIRAIGLESGDQRVWALPPFVGAIRRVWLQTRIQDEVLLDIRSDDPGGDYAMVVSLDGSVRRYPSGWSAGGWVGHSVVRLQRESERGLAIAGGEKGGGVRQVFPLVTR